MSKNINIISEDVCTGCGACNNCCPVDAIEMLEDQEGLNTLILIWINVFHVENV